MADGHSFANLLDQGQVQSGPLSPLTPPEGFDAWREVGMEGLETNNGGGGRKIFSGKTFERKL